MASKSSNVGSTVLAAGAVAVVTFLIVKTVGEKFLASKSASPSAPPPPGPAPYIPSPSPAPSTPTPSKAATTTSALLAAASGGLKATPQIDPVKANAMSTCTFYDLDAGTSYHLSELERASMKQGVPGYNELGILFMAAMPDGSTHKAIVTCT